MPALFPLSFFSDASGKQLLIVITLFIVTANSLPIAERELKVWINYLITDG
jgi:hypothetical protein